MTIGSKDVTFNVMLLQSCNMLFNMSRDLKCVDLKSPYIGHAIGKTMYKMKETISSDEELNASILNLGH